MDCLIPANRALDGDTLAPEVYSILKKRPHKRSPGEVSDLAQYFQKTRTFMRGLPIRGLEALCRRLTLVNVSPHCMLFRQGQPGDSMFMLIKGAAHIYQRYGSSIFAQERGDTDIQDCGALIGSASEGSIVGELCLIHSNSYHTGSVRADKHGADFVGIDRAAFWNFMDITRTGPGSESAQVAAALRAACCRRILEAAPSDRNESDLQALVIFLQELQAFQDLQHALLLKLCKGMSLEQVGPNTVICEEDEPGDSMFVVLSGVCDVRAQAPPEKRTIDDDCSTMKQSFTMGRKHLRRVRVAADERVLNDTDAMATNPVVHAASSSSDAAFWIEKFMKTAFQEKDPELMGHNNDITPLAVVAAARWRKTLADVQREEALQLEKAALAEESRLHELKSRSEGMAALIGKAAADNWKRATFGEQRVTAVDWQRESLHIQQQRLKANLLPVPGHIDSSLNDSEEDCENPSLLMMHVEERTTGSESLPANRLYNPNKQKLARLGQYNPGNANSMLRHELSQRSQLDTVLLSLEKNIQRQGPPKRLGRRDSRRITRALNRAMLSGASRQAREIRMPRLTRVAARPDWDTETNGRGTEYDDRRSSLEVSEHESFELDDRSAVATERSTISTGGESLDTQESLGWRRSACLNERSVQESAYRRSSCQALDTEAVEAQYGPIIKRVLPGQSFGELALLQPHSLRTATVLSAGPHASSSTQGHVAMGFAGNCDSLHTGNEAANTKRGTSGCVILLKLTQRLFDESVTSLQVAQLEERLQFLMRFPAFKELPRDKLTALLVFCHPENVPAGRVLATQGSAAESIFLIEEGQVAHVMEGESMCNPMDPNCLKQREPIPGLPFVNSGSISAVRKAIEKSERRGVRKPRSRFSMLQLADRIHAEDTLDDMDDEEYKDHKDLAAKTVVKHWGQQKTQILSTSISVIGKRADGAGDRYEARNVSGLVLLSLGPGEMCGELALGLPESNGVYDGEASRTGQKSVYESLRKAGHASLRPGQVHRSISLQGKKNSQVSKGEGRLLQYPEDHPATLITVKNCRLLRINAKDLTRFGSLVKEYIQAAALQRRETLAQLSDRMCRVNDTLQVALASSRSMPVDARQDTITAQANFQQTIPRYSGGPASVTESGSNMCSSGSFRTPSAFGSVADPDTGLQLSTRASWLPLPGTADSFWAGNHIQRVQSLPSTC